MERHRILNAFVLGAGLGTRLRPLTAAKPKPLIPVCNKPLICHAFDHLLAAGIENIVVNTHHQADAYDRAFPDGSYRGRVIHFRHEPDLLETGGGIKNVEDLLAGGPFVIYNGDILTDLPLEKAIAHHLDTANEITLVLRSCGGPLQISFDEKTQRITDIGARIRPGQPGRFLFTGVYIASSDFFRRIPPREKISVIPAFLDMIRSGAAIGGIVLDEGIWHDLGNREAYLDAHHVLARSPHFGPAPWIHGTASIASSAKINGASAIGAGSVIEAGATVADTIIWENARIRADARLRNCVVTGGTDVSGEHTDEDITA